MLSIVNLLAQCQFGTCTYCNIVFIELLLQLIFFTFFSLSSIVPTLWWPQASSGFGRVESLWVNLNSAAFCSSPLFVSICPLFPHNAMASYVSFFGFGLFFSSTLNKSSILLLFALSFFSSLSIVPRRFNFQQRPIFCLHFVWALSLSLLLYLDCSQTMAGGSPWVSR